jgi:hypothetical protein
MDVTGIMERETDKQKIAQFVNSLDEKSRAILHYLWWHRHAEISELRNTCDNPDDFEILHRLKDVINAKSQILRGKPIVSFEQSKVDPLTGEKILFSWWYLDDECLPFSTSDNSRVDIFNEKDDVIIIAEIPVSVELAGADMQCKNRILRVKLKKTSIAQYNSGIR